MLHELYSAAGRSSFAATCCFEEVGLRTVYALFVSVGCWCAIGGRLLGAITLGIFLLVFAAGINCFSAIAILALI
jgi:hypothetical protein